MHTRGGPGYEANKCVQITLIADSSSGKNYTAADTYVVRDRGKCWYVENGDKRCTLVSLSKIFPGNSPSPDTPPLVMLTS